MVGRFKDKTITIVGLGLMGGSIAKVLSQNSGTTIWAVDKNRKVLCKALEDGVIQQGFFFAENALPESDIVIVCLYPKLAIDFINDNMSLFKTGAVITDICGVKKPVIDGVIGNLRDDIDFVPAHPMAGSERQGYNYSFKELFNDCHYIITPLEVNRKESLALVNDLAFKLGAKNVVISTPDVHDEYIAYTSQIPHALSLAYMHASSERLVTPYAGGSFRDVSRVALINEVMWTELFAQNKEMLLPELKKLTDELSSITKMLEDDRYHELKEYMYRGAAIKENYDATNDS